MTNDTSASEALAMACAEVLPMEVCADLASMPADEAMGYACTLLIEQGIDPDEFLKRKGILE